MDERNIVTLIRMKKTLPGVLMVCPKKIVCYYKFDDIIFETPSINVVFAQPKALLGEVVEARFGAEFPIRFDFLDTIEGGNLSLQVHPYKRIYP